MGPGRPTDYNQELATKICEEIALGNSLRSVCRRDDMPAMSTVFRWLGEEDKTQFKEQYARACEERTEAMAEDLLDISDDGTNDFMEIETEDGGVKVIENRENVQRSKLRVDTRKWLMSKMKPKKYGEKLDLTSGGEKLSAATVLFSDTENEASASES